MGRTVLVVDDEPTILTALEGVLTDEGFKVVTALDGEAALEAVEAAPPDLVLLDIWMPKLDGLEALERLKADYPNLPVVMMSGAGTIETAVRATRLGAYDYIEKPLSYEKIIVTINNALSFGDMAETNLLLRQRERPRVRLTGRSPAINELRQQINLVAPTSAWVLITGENGTGKEVVAHTVHAKSPRSGRPMIEVNCAAIPDDLIESELFGHEKGSFTGATDSRRGKFDLAHKGTLFLDEIADMSLKTQAKILRILQESRFIRVGGTKTISVDVRVIAATNRDLPAEIEKGAFREDLYYRLNVVPLRVPPLRERLEDVPPLVNQFLAEFARKTNGEIKRISPRAMAALKDHYWPGNVRELRNLVERLVILTPGPEIGVEDLPEVFAGPDEVLVSSRDVTCLTLKEARAGFERDFISSRLQAYNGNVSATAESLGVERSYLHRKMKLLGVKNPKEGFPADDGQLPAADD